MTKKKHIIGVISTLLLGSTSAFAQIGIGTNSPSKSAALEVEGQEKGVLIPRVQLTGITTATPVLNPANSLLVYNTASAGSGDTKVSPGYYFWQASTTGGKWVRMVDSNTQITYTAGIGMLLDNTNNEFSRTGLEEIPGNNQEKGWRLIGVNPTNYGVIGNGAVDLSVSSLATNTFGATGYRAFAAGSNVEASGTNSVAIGGDARAEGTRSLAFNAGVAKGENSIAVGVGNYAIGNNSIAIGNHVQANKANAIAIGTRLIADGENETVFGLYNTPTTEPQGYSRRIFTIGNGSTGYTDFQSEALTVLADGKVGVNITHFEQQLASGSSNASGNIGHLLEAQLQVNGLIQSRGILASNGEEGSKVVVADEDGILRVRKTAEPGQFYMPSIVLPTKPAGVSTSEDDPVHYNTSTGVFTINLHSLYTDQFGSPVLSSDSNYSLVTYPANELAYFVTYTDSTVYTDLTLSELGVLTYKVSPGVNVTEKTYMNILLKVK